MATVINLLEKTGRIASGMLALHGRRIVEAQWVPYGERAGGAVIFAFEDGTRATFVSYGLYAGTLIDYREPEGPYAGVTRDLAAATGITLRRAMRVVAECIAQGTFEKTRMDKAAEVEPWPGSGTTAPS